MMRPLSAAELLAVWEENWRRPPLWQGLAMLAAACPEQGWDSLLAISIGDFNARLLTLHRWHFGPTLTAVTTCTGCGECIEVMLDATQLSASAGEPPPMWLEVDTAAEFIRVRVPVIADLIAAGATTSIDEAAELLLARCLERPDTIPQPETITAATALMERADPLAVIELGGTCPQCNRTWSAFLDVASILWHATQTWAQRTIQEIHLLARAYGWREADILNLTPTRRQAYLQMAYN